MQKPRYLYQALLAEFKTIVLKRSGIIRDFFTLSGGVLDSREGCGSIPELLFEVQRNTYVHLRGYVLEDRAFESVAFAYGLQVIEERVTSFDEVPWNIAGRVRAEQHECVHLKGETLWETGKSLY